MARAQAARWRTPPITAPRNPGERSGLRRTRNANKPGAWSIREAVCPEGRVEPAQPSRPPRAPAAAGLRWATPCTGPGETASGLWGQSLSPHPPTPTPHTHTPRSVRLLPHPDPGREAFGTFLERRDTPARGRHQAMPLGVSSCVTLTTHRARGRGWALHSFRAGLVTRSRWLHSLQVVGPGSEFKPRLDFLLCQRDRGVKGWPVTKPLPVLPFDAEMLRVPVPGPGLGPPWTNQENPSD